MDTHTTQQEEKHVADKMIHLPFGVVVNMLLNARRSIFKSDDTEPHLHRQITVDVNTAIVLKAFDAKEELIHVEMPGDMLTYQLQSPRVWDIKAWRESCELYRQHKARQDACAEMSRIRDEKIVELARLMKTDMQATRLYEVIDFAITLVMQRRVASCMGYGVDISMLDSEVTDRCIMFPDHATFLKDRLKETLAKE